MGSIVIFIYLFHANQRRKHAVELNTFFTRTVTMNQPCYIDDWLERFGLADWKSMGTSADISAQFPKMNGPDVA